MILQQVLFQLRTDFMFRVCLSSLISLGSSEIQQSIFLSWGGLNLSLGQRENLTGLEALVMW